MYYPRFTHPLKLSECNKFTRKVSVITFLLKLECFCGDISTRPTSGKPEPSTTATDNRTSERGGGNCCLTAPVRCYYIVDLLFYGSVYDYKMYYICHSCNDSNISCLVWSIQNRDTDSITLIQFIGKNNCTNDWLLVTKVITMNTYMIVSLCYLLCLYF